MAYTQAEVDAIIEALIIDNNTNRVTPDRVRQVCKAINSRIGADPASVGATSPLFFDNFSNTFYMQEANQSTDGYMTKEIFSRVKVIPFGELQIFGGPDKPAGNVSLQVDDVASFLYEKDGVSYFFTGAYKGGDPSDIDNNWTLIMNSPYKE